jgi:superfamily II DNA helicase RecQ
MKGREILIIILSTKEGKSVLFILSALIADRSNNIVVVPFMALIEDLMA